MPPHRQARRISASQPRYIISDDGDEFRLFSAYNPLPTPSPSATPPATSSHGRKRPPSYVRRPRNAFFIFRSEFCEQQKMSENGIESDHRHISRIAAHVWNNLAEDDKAVYKDRAEVEKAAHRAAYPNYRYAPVGKRNAPAAKRKVKRDGMADAVRCRQLAELVISGVGGEALQQAAKKLDEGAVEVELTAKTSKPKRLRQTRRGPPRLPAFIPEVPVEVILNQESPSPPPSLGLWTPATSISDSDALHGSPDAESQTWIDTPALSGTCKPGAQVSGSALQLLLDDFFSLPDLSDGVEVEAEFAPSPDVGPDALALQLCRTTLAPTHPGAFQGPPLHMHAPAYYTPTAAPVPPSWSAIAAGPPAVAAPPPSPVSADYTFQPAAHLPPPVMATSTSPWKAGANPAECAHEFSFPDGPGDEVDFDEFLTGL